MSWLGDHLLAAQRAARQLAGNLIGSLLTALVIGIALALPAGGLLLLDNAGRALGEASGRPEISIFMNERPGARQATRSRAAFKPTRVSPRNAMCRATKP